MDGVYTMMGQVGKEMKPIYKFVIESGILTHTDPKHPEALKMFPEGPVDESVLSAIKKAMHGGSYYYLDRQDLGHLAAFGEIIQQLGIKIGHLAYNPHFDKMMAVKSIDHNGVVSFFQPPGTATDTAKYHISLPELARQIRQKILRPWE
jgi:hypothetical protein